jgi:hypothetical protein
MANVDRLSLNGSDFKSEPEKLPVEESESVGHEWAERDAADIDRPPGYWGRFLKKNPSPEFIADVAKMNDTQLDPVEVKRIMRKVDALIIPALSICYMVRAVLKYTRVRSLTSSVVLLRVSLVSAILLARLSVGSMDKTTLSYAAIFNRTSFPWFRNVSWVTMFAVPS